MSRGGKRYKPSLAGTNLEFDPRTGMYRWRRLDKRTGKRVRRGTGARDLRKAILIARRFDDEYERERVGLATYDNYRQPLVDFIEPFLESLTVYDERIKLLRAQLERAFGLLHLHCLGDLQDFIKIEQRLLRLQGEGTGKFGRKTLRRCFQDPLKQFSKYLTGRREMDSDPLAAWPRVKMDPPERKRRAIMPEEFPRILAASDCLDTMSARKHSMRPIWTALLMAAPRIGALAALDVKDLDRKKGRLLLKGNHKKRAGAGTLDKSTLSEVAAYVGKRKEGPLFLSAQGTRINTDSSLDQWRAAASLAFVDLEWPQGEPRSLKMAYLVHYALMSGRVRVAMGGPLTGPSSPGSQKRAARKRLAAQVGRIADAIREGWKERMRGVDQHCLRMTHRTWALAAGVPEILIDRQLGHTSPAGDAALQAAWSAVGRAHYTDMNFLALDARRSAEAVRGIVDRAEAEFLEVLNRGETAFGSPEPHASGASRTRGRLRAPSVSSAG